MNFTLYGYESRWIAVDCGMLIRQDLPDSPLQIPDVEVLASAGITLDAVVITHGHEDHIGALAWVWPRLGCPIWASPLAAGLLRQKFAEQGLSVEAINVFEIGATLDLGAFRVRTLPVTHSIPESCALLIATASHRILHTGDWKLDETPLIGPAIDPGLFKSLAPVDLLVGDSTNALQPGHSRSEGDVAAALGHYLQQCQGRVVVSCFASNLARILAIGKAAERHGRRVALLGRAMSRMVQISRGLGYLDDFPNLVPLQDIGYLPREEVVLIATGSQGEPRSALSRLARNSHPDVELEAGDAVIFSSKAIPGNEEAIARVQNAFKVMGVEVYEEKQHPDIHASGHPAQEELRTFYGWVKPSSLVPVHGEPSHQEAHQRLAQALGIAVPLIPSNGQWLRWNGHELQLHTTLALTPRLVTQRHSSPLKRKPMLRQGIALLLSVIHSEEHWERVGRLIMDGDGVDLIDEVALSDWLDATLEVQDDLTLDELTVRLTQLVTQWLSERLQYPLNVELEVINIQA